LNRYRNISFGRAACPGQGIVSGNKSFPYFFQYKTVNPAGKFYLPGSLFELINFTATRAARLEAPAPPRRRITVARPRRTAIMRPES
jgi:hypothetical protein